VLQLANGVVAMFVYAGLADRVDIGGPRAPAANVAGR
jgi:hypothetical protein